jgi:hypothetical protein
MMMDPHKHIQSRTLKLHVVQTYRTGWRPAYAKQGELATLKTIDMTDMLPEQSMQVLLMTFI